MNEQIRARVILIAIVCIAILAFIGVTSLCLTLFFRNYADPAVLTAIITLTSNLTGALAAVVGFRILSQNPPDGNGTTVSTSPPATVTVQQEGT